jgi:hypothetical protein
VDSDLSRLIPGNVLMSQFSKDCVRMELVPYRVQLWCLILVVLII